MRGPHGHECLNEAGKELMSFLSTNEATVCNTWFQKKPIRKAIWQHPGTKQWHCIDFVIMRQSEHRKCIDVDVMRGAECYTDHQLLQMKLLVGSVNKYRKPPASNAPQRFDVSRYKGDIVDDQGKLTTKGIFQDRVAQRLKSKWKNEGLAEEKWNLLKSTLCEAAESTLGKQTRRNPDWFVESAPKLKPLFDKRNQLYLKYLSTNKEEDRINFRNVRREARRVTREAKDEWFLQRAEEAQAGRHGGKVIWRCIRDIQRGRQGLVPLKCVSVRDEKGKDCDTPQQQQ